MAVRRTRAPRNPAAPEAPVDRNSFALGERVPERVAQPATVEELAATLRACDEAGEAVVLFGGGTLQGLGSAPARYDVAVSLAAIAGIAAYEPNDLTVSVLAGTKLADLARTLRAKGQFVPIDAPRPGQGTVVGAIAAGWAGPPRRVYGSARDLIIGSTVVLADGTVAKAGGMVVKNVTGYDMSKLYAGSLGTLGALARVNFKALPMPAVQRAAIAPLPERTRARAVAHLKMLDVEPAVAAVVHGFEDVEGRDGVEGRLVLVFEGSQAVTDRCIRDLRSALGAAGVPETRLVDFGAAEVLQRLIDAYAPPPHDRTVSYRLFGLPADVEPRAAALVRLARERGLECETSCDLNKGDVVARVSSPDLGTFETAIVPFDEALRDKEPARITSAPQRLRALLDAWGAPPAALAVMRGLKARFDPRNTLAPGRFAGGI